MSSAIAILTFRRHHAIQVFLDSILAAKLHEKYPVAVFEDCANADATVPWLVKGAELKGTDYELAADYYLRPDGVHVYVGLNRQGVAGQSNRALRWFERGGWDHLCLCNDDLVTTGDFVAEYAAAHARMGVGFFEFCDFTDELHKAQPAKHLGRDIRIINRMVGIMLSLTKECHQKIGYFDTDNFGLFGEDHSEWNNRARRAGFINLHKKPQVGLDIVSKYLAHQEVPSSITPAERPKLDREAAEAMERVAREFYVRDVYRPFRLRHAKVANSGDGTSGLFTRALDTLGYAFVHDHAS